MEQIYSWSEISDDFGDGLILGNGASIAFDTRFKYQSLKERAQHLNLIHSDVQQVFQHLDSEDFELVLRMLWHANKINEALKISDNRTTQAYQNVREAFINVIQNIHVAYEEVSKYLATAATFMSRFSTVVSLSYDVLVYWAVLVGNENELNRFKDCFLRGEFQKDWERFRKPHGKNPAATLVFYPHGNLILVADLEGTELKIQADAGSHPLNTVIQKWSDGTHTPVFVSEGTSEQKRAAIRRSPYLSKVYEEVLPALGKSVVVFGWAIHECDDHLLDAVCQGTTSQFAVAVDPAATNIGEFQATVRQKLTERLKSNTLNLKFFDQGSPGCWITC